MQVILRDYQQECINTMAAKFKEDITRQLVVLPTAAGKTIVFTAFMSEYWPNKRILVLAHTEKLLTQTRDKYLFVAGAKHYKDVGILNGNYKNFDNRIIIAGISTISRDDTLFKFSRNHFDLIIADECHHSLSASWIKTLHYFGVKAPIKQKELEKLDFDSREKLIKKPMLAGFTATPIRTDDKQMGSLYQETVYSKDITWMLENGMLCPPVAIEIQTNIDISNVINNSSGDFNEDALAAKIDIDYCNTLAVEAYEKLCPDEIAIVFCVNKEHTKNVCKEFIKAGIAAEYLDADTPKGERERIYSDHEKGIITVLCNHAVAIDGHDNPAISTVINLRPTQSQGLFSQIVGRGLRLYPSKQFAKIIDISHRSEGRKIVTVGDVLGISAEPLTTETIKAKRKEKQETDEIWQKAINETKYIKTDYQISIKYKDLFHSKREYVWINGKNGNKYIEFKKGESKAILEIRPDFIDKEKYNVYLDYKGKVKSLLDQGTIFEWAFSYAESYLATNVSKKAKKLIKTDAAWRKMPITEKQKEKILKWFSDNKLLANIAIRMFIKNNKEKFSGLKQHERMEHAKKYYKKDITKLFNDLKVTDEKINLLSKGEASIIMEMAMKAFKEKTFRPYILPDGRVNVGVAACIYNDILYKIFSQRSR